MQVFWLKKKKFLLLFFFTEACGADVSDVSSSSLTSFFTSGFLSSIFIPTVDVVVDVSIGTPLPPSPEQSSLFSSDFTGFSSVLRLLSFPPLEQLPVSLSSSSSCCLISILGSRLAVEVSDCGCWEEVSRLLTEAGVGA